MKQNTTKAICNTAFLFALFLKVFGAGFSYFCTLDDYIQYGCYPRYDNLFHVYFEMGTASARPLAALADPAVWGAFFPHMVFALLIITMLHFVSAKLFDRCLRDCGITITPFFYLVYLLLPLGFEGTYWISASSRIVVGLFFTALSATLLIKYIKTKKCPYLLVYCVCCLASFGFYESVMVLSGLAQALIILKYSIEKKRYQRLYLLAVPLLCAISVLLYYKLASALSPVVRTTSFSLKNLGGRTKELLSQLGYIFTAGLYRTTLVGFADGAKRLAQSGMLGMLVSALILILSAFCAYFGGKTKLSSPRAKYCVPAGLLMILLPLLPNILVPDVWLTYRSIVVCLPGFCVLFAPLLSHILRGKGVAAVTIFVTSVLFLVGCYNEVQTYKEVNELDRKIANEIVAHLDADVLSAQKNVVLVFENEVITPQTSLYKDHVKSAFYVDWAATGIVRATAGNIHIKTVTPVYALDAVDTSSAQVLYIDEFYHVTEEQHE